MECSSIVDDPRECWTLVCENKRREPGLERKLISDYGHTHFLPTRANLERRTGKTPGALSKGTRGIGRADASLVAGFTAYQGLHPTTIDFGTAFFLFLHGVTFGKPKRFG